MKVKIIGGDSSNRRKLFKNVKKVLDNKTEKIEILENEKYLSKYHITNTPGLVIEEKVVSQGKILNERDIKNFIKILS